jgi:hypothetical protein
MGFTQQILLLIMKIVLNQRMDLLQWENEIVF